MLSLLGGQIHTIHISIRKEEMLGEGASPSF